VSQFGFGWMMGGVSVLVVDLIDQAKLPDGVTWAWVIVAVVIFLLIDWRLKR